MGLIATTSSITAFYLIVITCIFGTEEDPFSISNNSTYCINLQNNAVQIVIGQLASDISYNTISVPYIGNGAAEFVSWTQFVCTLNPTAPLGIGLIPTWELQSGIGTNCSMIDPAYDPDFYSYLIPEWAKQIYG